MSTPNRVTFEVWAQLFLCETDCNRVREFLVSELGVRPTSVVRNMHITVYHARRPMPGLKSLSERTSIVLAASETRFMVMAPGGENPSPELDPGKRTVGIRVHKQSGALTQILEFRADCSSMKHRRFSESGYPARTKQVPSGRVIFNLTWQSLGRGVG